jgi:hypothetical protein
LLSLDPWVEEKIGLRADDGAPTGTYGGGASETMPTRVKEATMILLLPLTRYAVRSLYGAWRRRRDRVDGEPASIVPVS